MLSINTKNSLLFLLLLLVGSGHLGCPTISEALRSDEGLATDIEAELESEEVEIPEPKLDAAPVSFRDVGPVHRNSRSAVDQALHQASGRAIGIQRLSPDGLDYRQILDPNRALDGSLSLGTIRQGALRNAASLALVGDHHEIIERHRTRGTNFGTAELITAIERAAAEVAREYGGAPLRVGNIGFRRGGSIPWSNSHEAGRDADLAFYVLDEQGRSVPSPDLIGFDDDGRALEHSLVFDAQRTWGLVRALLTDSTINVQWLFISEGLKEILLLHAVSIGEDRELVERAASILHQPTDALPHDDHLHLRIGCSRRDRLEGCVDWGPRWPWYDWHDRALLARTHELQHAFDDPSVEIRRRAIEFLHQIRSPYAPEIALLHGIRDVDEEVRETAFAILDDLPIRSDAAVLALGQSLDDNGLDDERRQVLYGALRRADLDSVADLAFERYRSPELDVRERAMALRALSHHMRPELIPPILDALAQEQTPLLRGILARQLYRIAARTDGLDWTENPVTEEHVLALEEWRSWYDESPGDRDSYLRDFVAELGIEEWADLTYVDELIALIGHSNSDYELYNINLILSQWTGRWVPRDWQNGEAAFRFWSRWWNRNRARMLNPRPRPWEEYTSLD